MCIIQWWIRTKIHIEILQFFHACYLHSNVATWRGARVPGASCSITQIARARFEGGAG